MKRLNRQKNITNVARIISTFLILCAHTMLGQSSIVFHDVAIKADGVLDEKVWQYSTTLSGFHNFYPINEGLAEHDTEVRLFASSTHLNIAFIYHDTTSRVRVNSLKRDKYPTGFHLSDHVGIIIDPYQNQQIGYYFALNGKGCKLDALIANYDEENLSWDVNWEANTSVDKTNKIYEFSIPLSVFGYKATNKTWNFQFYNRDIKSQLYTVYNKFDRGFLQFDTRFAKPLTFDRLEDISTNKVVAIPSITSTAKGDNNSSKTDFSFKPSVDVQYKLTDGLRLDATVNPDFSQVDVDEQQINLTRFSIIFPERRNFFIENSDIFTSLGATDNITPFYSRFIGSDRNIKFGLKLSGNVSKRTRVGLLNVQTDRNSQRAAQNYTVAVAKHQLNPVWNATGYLINRNSTEKWEFSPENYNRIIGLKTNYLSKQRKWSGSGLISQSYTAETNQENIAYAVENNYSTREVSFSTRLSGAQKNYITDIGFVPRLEQYDPETSMPIRQGYTQVFQDLRLLHFPTQGAFNAIRYFNGSSRLYLDESGNFNELNLYYNAAAWFTNQSSIYVNVYYDDIRLQYAFSPFRNDFYLSPGSYQNKALRLGWNGRNNGDFFYSMNAQTGTFYGGTRNRISANAGFRQLPLFTVEANYVYNRLDFSQAGARDVHLIGIRSEIFFSNSLNWTTYFQYNEQIKNININSRIQWEYKPLSFIYLVVSNNYTERFMEKDWTISFKINRRLTF